MEGVTQIGRGSVMYSWLHAATLNPGVVGVHNRASAYSKLKKNKAFVGTERKGVN